MVRANARGGDGDARDFCAFFGFSFFEERERCARFKSDTKRRRAGEKVGEVIEMDANACSSRADVVFERAFRVRGVSRGRFPTIRCRPEQGL